MKRHYDEAFNHEHLDPAHRGRVDRRLAVWEGFGPVLAARRLEPSRHGSVMAGIFIA